VGWKEERGENGKETSALLVLDLDNWRTEEGLEVGGQRGNWGLIVGESREVDGEATGKAK
jgi:hypothetical protein